MFLMIRLCFTAADDDKSSAVFVFIRGIVHVCTTEMDMFGDNDPIMYSCPGAIVFSAIDDSI